MSDKTEITAEKIKDKSIEQLSQIYGPPTTVEFILDDNVSEFRVGLLNEFDKDQTASGNLIVNEITFSLNEEDNLTVWYHGTDYVRHMVYGKMTDF
ncbi:MAG: hypothetical protein ABJL73_00285 [Lentilitoribacter sp.]